MKLNDNFYKILKNIFNEEPNIKDTIKEQSFYEKQINVDNKAISNNEEIKFEINNKKYL